MKLLALCTTIFFFSICGVSEASAQKDKKVAPHGRIFVLAGDGFTDDTEPLNAWGRGEIVLYNGKPLGDIIENKLLLISWKVKLHRKSGVVRNNMFIYDKYTEKRNLISCKKTLCYKNKTYRRLIEYRVPKDTSVYW